MFTFWDEGKETYILFEYMNLDAAMQVDTEYSDNSKTKVNGQEALLQKTESGELVLYWPKDDYLLVLHGGRSLRTKKELVQMAEDDDRHQQCTSKSQFQWSGCPLRHNDES